MRVWLIGAAIVAVLGGGVAMLAADLMGDEAGAYALVPVDAVAVVHATLDPSLDQKRALASLTQRLPEGAAEQLQTSVAEALESALGQVDLNFEEDVKPWLGGEVAVFMQGDLTQPQVAVLLETNDPEAALDVARRLAAAEDLQPTEESYRDHTFSVLPPWDATEARGAFGIVGEFLGAGTPDGRRGAIDASADGGIEGNADYRELVDALAPDRLLTYWADTPSIFEAMQRQLPPDQAEQLTASPLVGQQQPQAGALFVDDDAVVLEAVSPKPDGEPALLQMVPTDEGLLAALPQDAWLGLAIPSIGTNLTALLDSAPEGAEQAEQQFTQMTGLDLRTDVLSWMGDAALFVKGDALPSLGGALVVNSDDPEATRTFLQRVVDAGMQQGLAVAPTRAGDLEGFALVDGSAPVNGTVLAGDRLILAVDSGQAVEAESVVAALTGDGPRLADSDVFLDATASLGDDYVPMFFLDVGAVTQVVRSAFGQSSTPPEFTEAEQYLQELSHVIAGVRDDGDLVVQRVVIGATAE